MNEERRSGCPINLTLEVVGDKWSLLIIRDMMFGNRRHFSELLTRSEEGISSNILADRLKTLRGQGIVSWADDPSHKQKGIYSLTEQGIELLAGAGADGRLGIQISSGHRGTRHPRQTAQRRRPEDVGGVHGRIARDPSRREAAKRKAGPGVGERLQAAYQKVMAKKAKGHGAQLTRKQFPSS